MLACSIEAEEVWKQSGGESDIMESYPTQGTTHEHCIGGAFWMQGLCFLPAVDISEHGGLLGMQ